MRRTGLQWCSVPGPKARLRHRILTAVGVVLVVAIAYVIYLQFEKAGQLKAFMWEPFVTDPEVWTSYLIPGLKGTFTAAAISIVLAVVFGLLFGMGRLSQHRAVRIGRSVDLLDHVDRFVEIGAAVLVQFFFERRQLQVGCFGVRRRPGGRAHL